MDFYPNDCKTKKEAKDHLDRIRQYNIGKQLHICGYGELVDKDIKETHDNSDRPA